MLEVNAWGTRQIPRAPPSPGSRADARAPGGGKLVPPTRPGLGWSRPHRRPNILLLFTDQQRADALGCSGNPAIRTPNLDELAAGGIRFPNALSPVPICIAARYSLITGLRPRDHRFVSNRMSPGPRPELPTLMALLADAGYRTHGIGKFHFQPYGRRHGFSAIESMEELPARREDDDYLRYLQAVGWGHKREPHGVRHLLYQQPQTTDVPAQHVGSAWVADRAVAFLRSYRRPEPFFLWASWIAPHPPWNVPRPWDERYRLEDMPDPVDFDRPLEALPPVCRRLREVANLERASQARVRRITALYYAQCSLIDEGVGRILAELDHRGMADDTLVVFASDHGEMLNDHGLAQKSNPFDGATRVPLLVRWPARVAAARVDDDRATLLDILPTCLDAAGVAYPGPYSPSGRSLLRADAPRDEAVVEFGAPPLRWLSIRDSRFKFNVFMEGGYEELYDRTNDPGERRNVAEAMPDVAALYRRRLVTWERAHGLPESLAGERFGVSPVRRAEEPNRNANFPIWVQHLSSEELALMETPGQAVMAAIARETTYSLDELDLAFWKRHGGDLSGTPYEPSWRRA